MTFGRLALVPWSAFALVAAGSTSFLEANGGAFVVAGISLIGVIWSGWWTRSKVHEVHILVNQRSTDQDAKIKALQDDNKSLREMVDKLLRHIDEQPSTLIVKEKS